MVVSGTTEAMRLMEYDSETRAILVAGTFNGNPLVTVAGTAVLWDLSKELQLYARLNPIGDHFRVEINRFAQEGGYPKIATGIGSTFWMHTLRGPVSNVRDVRQGHRATRFIRVALAITPCG